MAKIMANKRYLKLGDITAYKTSKELSDYIYEIVSKWNWFDKRTLGVQLRLIWLKALDVFTRKINKNFITIQEALFLNLPIGPKRLQLES